MWTYTAGVRDFRLVDCLRKFSMYLLKVILFSVVTNVMWVQLLTYFRMCSRYLLKVNVDGFHLVLRRHQCDVFCFRMLTRYLVKISSFHAAYRHPHAKACSPLAFVAPGTSPSSIPEILMGKNKHPSYLLLPFYL